MPNKGSLPSPPLVAAAVTVHAAASGHGSRNESAVNSFLVLERAADSGRGRRRRATGRCGRRGGCRPGALSSLAAGTMARRRTGGPGPSPRADAMGLQPVRCRAGEVLASDQRKQSHRDTGAAAHRYGLFGLHWLTEMDGQKITGEQQFTNAGFCFRSSRQCQILSDTTWCALNLIGLQCV